MFRPSSRFERKDLKFLLASLLLGGILVWGAARYSSNRKWDTNFKFPGAHLAALDRDLQARFAEVPDKDFGIERAYGNQHYLYDPQTPREKATIAALKKQKVEAGFYLMSRALWLRHWDGYGYKPIQGPVLLTGKLQSPLPRFVNFSPADRSETKPIINQEQSNGADGGDTLIARLPNGAPVPGYTPPAGALRVNQIQELGNRVFEMAEYAPKTAKIGLTETAGKDWKVVAVPIRAGSKACLPCHVYDSNINGKRQSSKAKLGDALGVAFYLYRQLENSTPKTNPQNVQKK